MPTPRGKISRKVSYNDKNVENLLSGVAKQAKSTISDTLVLLLGDRG
jgi:hypothetical protein